MSIGLRQDVLSDSLLNPSTVTRQSHEDDWFLRDFSRFWLRGNVVPEDPGDRLVNFRLPGFYKELYGSSFKLAGLFVI